MAITIHNLASSQGTDGSTQTIGHHHKQALSRCLDAGLTLLVNEDTTRNIKEVEGDTIYDARENEENHTRHCRITYAKESETEHPCKERHQHHNLDAKTLQEEGNHQDTQCLTNLRDRRQQGSIVGSKGVGKLWYSLKMSNERTSKTIGYLQTHT